MRKKQSRERGFIEVINKNKKIINKYFNSREDLKYMKNLYMLLCDCDDLNNFFDNNNLEDLLGKD